VESADELTAQTIGALLADVASDRPAPGGGSVAALAVALAAGLAGMASRLSARHWDGAAAAVERADELRARATSLAPADAHAYEDVLAASRLPEGAERDAAVADALGRAADPPLSIAQAGAEAARLAADAAARGNPNLRGDAATGALLAAAAGRAAANLVAIDLAAAQDDERIARAQAYAADAAAAAERALAG
jgi:formiminotetrahydrofolate cyclodeaminase